MTIQVELDGMGIAAIIVAVSAIPAGTLLSSVYTVVRQIRADRKLDHVAKELAEKVDGNTKVTEAAKVAAAEDTAAVAAKVGEAQQLSIANADTIATVVAKVDGVAGQVVAVRTATDGLTERLQKAALAQGTAEGHLAGVMQEQARAASATQL